MSIFPDILWTLMSKLQREINYPVNKAELSHPEIIF